MAKIIKITVGIIILGILVAYVSINNLNNLSVNGVIRDTQSNDPVIGAKVTFDQNTIVTTLTGEYEFNHIKKGFHMLKINIEGYKSYSYNFINLESDIRKDILLEKTVE